MIKVGLIGCGYWGKNYASTLNNIPELNLKYIHDLCMPKILVPSGVIFARKIEEVLEDSEIKGVMIVTPTVSHYEIAMQAIKAGKHVLIEKPITTRLDHAEELCALAEKEGVSIMAGHVFKHNPAVKYLKEQIEKGELGNLRYIESRRVGLGPIRQDVSVLWDFAAHDIYIANHLIGSTPTSVSCRGISHNKKVDDIAALNMVYQEDIFASIYVNWEHPIKERKTIVGGTKKAILFDDIQPSEKITIYERGVDYRPSTGDFGEFQASTREGNIIMPKLKITAPLEEQIRHFGKVIAGEERCISDGYDGLETVKILEAAEKSRRQGGLEIKI